MLSWFEVGKEGIGGWKEKTGLFSAGVQGPSILYLPISLPSHYATNVITSSQTYIVGRWLVFIEKLSDVKINLLMQNITC
jgi:hypothetical protein